MSIPARITATWLKEQNACADQVALFAKTFPRGGKPTKANLLKAARAGLDLDWLAGFLSPPASKAYYEATAAALKAYDEATAPASKAYDEATAPASKAYDEAIAPALAAALDKEDR